MSTAEKLFTRSAAAPGAVATASAAPQTSTGAVGTLPWIYSTDADEMTSGQISYASVSSANSLSLGWPYQGLNQGRLTVRKHPKYGTDVYVRIDKGQILCRSWNNCKISVRFDDAKPVTFEGSEGTDNSSNLVFLRNARRFIELARKSKRILVELTLYQAGNQVLEFTVAEPLVWGSPGKSTNKPRDSAKPKPAPSASTEDEESARRARLHELLERSGNAR